MVGQPGFFDCDERLKALSAAGEPLERWTPPSGEDVRDPQAHPGPGSIAADEMRRHRLAAGLFALELRPPPPALEEGEVGGRAVGGVGPHRARGVVPIKHGAELWRQPLKSKL
jgi:hypothetical protein